MEEVVQRLIVDRPFLPTWLTPFAEDGGGNPFCIDRRTSRVVFFDHEHFTDESYVPADVAESLPYLLDHLISQDELYAS